MMIFPHYRTLCEKTPVISQFCCTDVMMLFHGSASCFCWSNFVTGYFDLICIKGLWNSQEYIQKLSWSLSWIYSGLSEFFIRLSPEIWESLPALLALWEGNTLVTSRSLTQRVSFATLNVFFIIIIKMLNKQLIYHLSVKWNAMIVMWHQLYEYLIIASQGENTI